MLLPETVRGYIAQGLECEHLTVSGDGMQYWVTECVQRFTPCR